MLIGPSVGLQGAEPRRGGGGVLLARGCSGPEPPRASVGHRRLRRGFESLEVASDSESLCHCVSGPLWHHRMIVPVLSSRLGRPWRAQAHSPLLGPSPAGTASGSGAPPAAAIEYGAPSSRGAPLEAAGRTASDGDCSKRRSGCGPCRYGRTEGTSPYSCPGLAFGPGSGLGIQLCPDHSDRVPGGALRC
jgi:hypothetical protein